MAIITRLNRDGSTSYQVKLRTRDGLSWHPSKTFSDFAEAEGHQADLLLSNQKGGKVLSNDAREVIFADYWGVWKEENRTAISEGWKLSQNQMYRDHVAPLIGHMLMIDIGIPEIGRIMRTMKEKGLGEQMRVHVYNLLNKMFGDAVEYYDMLRSSPVKERFHKAKLQKKERSFLPPELAWKLLAAAKDQSIGPAVWVETLAALRSEAMIPLQWKSVFWESDQILICRAWKKKVRKIEDYPKGGDWEYVPMVPPLKEYLWERWQACLDPEAFVCPSINGEMLNYDSYLKSLTRLCKDAGVPRMTPHELRHSCTELWTEQGAGEEDLRRLLNHKSAEATRRYIHRTDGRLRKIGDKIAAFEVIQGGQSRGGAKTSDLGT